MPEELMFPYTAYDLTQEVNRIPNTFGLINEMGLAPSEAKRSRMVRIDYRDGIVHVLAHSEPGSPSAIGGDTEQSGVIFTIPHFTYFENILVGDIDGLLEVVGGQIDPKSLDKETARKLAIIRRNHNITREFLRIGMLKGQIRDGKLRTLYDLFTVFELEQKTVDFALGTAGTNVMDKCEEVSDHIISNLKGETSSGVTAIVDSKFFSKFVDHPKVEKYWLQAQNAVAHTGIGKERRGGNYGRVFSTPFNGLTLIEYKGGLPVKSNEGVVSTEKNVADNTGHAFPEGTQDMFRTFDAPAYHINRANEAPDADDLEGEIFVSVKELDHGAGFELKSQTNAIALCKQPECLVKIHTSN